MKTDSAFSFMIDKFILSLSQYCFYGILVDRFRSTVGRSDVFWLGYDMGTFHQFN